MKTNRPMGWGVGAGLLTALLSSAALPGNAAATEQAAGDTRAAAPRPGATPGLAIALGLGHSYASLFGVQLSYAFTAPDSSLAVAPFAALGYFPDWDEAQGRTSAGLGVMGYWGQRHRLVGELNYSALAIRTLPLHGSIVALQPVYGFSVCAGYEFLSDWGWFFRTLLGAGVTVDPGPEGVALLSLGTGWKF